MPYSAADVKAETKPGRYRVDKGLYLQVSPTGTKSWILRYKLHGRARHMGLGEYPTVAVGDARTRAAKARLSIADGTDPLAEKRARIEAMKAARTKAKTFAECAAIVIEKKGATLKNPKHLAQWTSTLTTYVYPSIGSKPVGTITKGDVAAVLEPIWRTKNETADRVRGRMEAVFDYAKAMGYRDGDNPAAWKGNLEPILGGIDRKPKHHPALPYSRIAEFIVGLRQREGTAARALEFAILTAARSGEARGAKWSEIDLEAKLWTIPADRMKARELHEVPLSDAAVLLLKALPRLKGEPFVFPAARGGELSDMALSQVVRRMNGEQPTYVDAKGSPVVPHGFRSTFREWAGNMTAHPREVIEHALAHRLPDAAERAYQRSTLLPKRLALMADWASYCDRVPTGANVVPLSKARA